MRKKVVAISGLIIAILAVVYAIFLGIMAEKGANVWMNMEERGLLAAIGVGMTLGFFAWLQDGDFD